MFCAICHNDLIDCNCKDKEERLNRILQNSSIICKWCTVCKKHYALCKCETPKWIMR